MEVCYELAQLIIVHVHLLLVDIAGIIRTLIHF